MGPSETIAHWPLPVTVVVFDDAALTLIELKQRAGQGDAGAVRFTPVDYAGVARSMATWVRAQVPDTLRGRTELGSGPVLLVVALVAIALAGLVLAAGQRRQTGRRARSQAVLVTKENG